MLLLFKCFDFWNTFLIFVKYIDFTLNPLFTVVSSTLTLVTLWIIHTLKGVEVIKPAEGHHLWLSSSPPPNQCNLTKGQRVLGTVYQVTEVTDINLLIPTPEPKTCKVTMSVGGSWKKHTYTLTHRPSMYLHTTSVQVLWKPPKYLHCSWRSAMLSR